MSILYSLQSANFNPRSHEGSDAFNFGHFFLMLYFNPRSHEGSDEHIVIINLDHHDFNPRSHEGSDGSCTSI